MLDSNIVFGDEGCADFRTVMDYIPEIFLVNIQLLFGEVVWYQNTIFLFNTKRK